MSNRYVVRTFGCQMNEHDSERIAGVLEQLGFQRGEDPASAAVVVFNTCTIRENADERFYGQVNQLREARRRNPGMRIVVAGCLAQGEGAGILERAPHVDVVVGTHQLGRLADLLRAADGRRAVVDTSEPDPHGVGTEEELPWRPGTSDEPWRAWVTIQTGCDNRCAFCIVPRVRGPEVSRPFGEVVAEVRRRAAGGVTEVTLLGQNVNSYGRDLVLALRRAETAEAAERAAARAGVANLGGAVPRVRPLFADLLRAVGAVPGIRRVRFTSPHPKDMRTETFRAMAETAAVCESLHFPLQSGSDRILAAMHRGYTADRFLAKLAEARTLIPDLAVSTDIIVGFPGETDADFEATLEVAAEARFDAAYTFIYSPRPGTEAATLVDRFVDPELVHARFERLVRVTERSAAETNRARVGLEEEILVEGPSRKDPSVATARTRQHKLVHLAGVDASDLGGRYGLARIVGARAHYLLGELVELEPASDPGASGDSHRSVAPAMSRPMPGVLHSAK